VRGEVDAPSLVPIEDGGWLVSVAGGSDRRFTTEQLLAVLREPRPFAPAEPVT
jgi:hypothetical protein